jgi:hypothetical protein
MECLVSKSFERKKLTVENTPGWRACQRPREGRICLMRANGLSRRLRVLVGDDHRAIRQAIERGLNPVRGCDGPDHVQVPSLVLPTLQLRGRPISGLMPWRRGDLGLAPHPAITSESHNIRPGAGVVSVGFRESALDASPRISDKASRPGGRTPGKSVSVVPFPTGRAR